MKICFLTATFPHKISQLEHASSLNSELDGNPPLWVTRRRHGKIEEVYINNAKILTDKSNIELVIHDMGETKKQVSLNYFFFMKNN